MKLDRIQHWWKTPLAMALTTTTITLICAAFILVVRFCLGYEPGNLTAPASFLAGIFYSAGIYAKFFRRPIAGAVLLKSTLIFASVNFPLTMLYFYFISTAESGAHLATFVASETVVVSALYILMLKLSSSALLRSILGSEP